MGSKSHLSTTEITFKINMRPQDDDKEKEKGKREVPKETPRKKTFSPSVLVVSV